MRRIYRVHVPGKQGVEPGAVHTEKMAVRRRPGLRGRSGRERDRAQLLDRGELQRGPVQVRQRAVHQQGMGVRPRQRLRRRHGRGQGLPFALQDVFAARVCVPELQVHPEHVPVRQRGRLRRQLGRVQLPREERDVVRGRSVPVQQRPVHQLDAGVQQGVGLLGRQRRAGALQRGRVRPRGDEPVRAQMHRHAHLVHLRVQRRVQVSLQRPLFRPRTPRCVILALRPTGGCWARHSRVKTIRSSRCLFSTQVNGGRQGVRGHRRMHGNARCVFAVLSEHPRVVLLQVRRNLLRPHVRRTDVQTAR